MRKQILLFGVVLTVMLSSFAIYIGATRSTALAPAAVENPIAGLTLHLVGVHVIKDAQGRQFVAHHFCQQLTDGVIQCAIFDSDGPGARLIGTEYVVSADVYNSFSSDEQQYWHPHTYEIDAGLLAAPELPADQAKSLLETIRSTYGRTWNVWATDKDPLPVGAPELAWSITGPDQLLPDIEQKLKEAQH